MADAVLPLDARISTLTGGIDRAEAALRIVSNYAKGHALADVGIGLAGTLIPLPGAGFAALVASIGIQGPLIYQPMAREIAALYIRSEDAETLRITDAGAVVGAGLDIAASFGTEFFTEIAGELIHEAGIGAVLSWIPFLGGVAAAAVDAAIALKLTRRVGTMVATYFENGGSWVESRRATYEIAKDLVASPFRDSEPTAKAFYQAVTCVPAVAKSRVGTVRKMVDMLRHAGLQHAAIRQALREQGIEQGLIDGAMTPG